MAFHPSSHHSYQPVSTSFGAIKYFQIEDIKLSSAEHIELDFDLLLLDIVILQGTLVAMGTSKQNTSGGKHRNR